MTTPSSPHGAALTNLREELVRTSYRLHHAERDHLEYGIPADRDTPLPRDPSGATLAGLERTCADLRAQIGALQHTTLPLSSEAAEPGSAIPPFG